MIEATSGDAKINGIGRIGSQPIALAAAGATFFLVFQALAWLVGMPGPYLWFGSDDRWTDIVAAVFSIAVGFAIWNLFCSFLLRLFFLLRAPFTELDEPKL